MKELNLNITVSGNSEFYQNPLKNTGSNTLSETFSIKGILTEEPSNLTITIKGVDYIVNSTDITYIANRLRGCEFDDLNKFLANHIDNLSYWNENLITYQEKGMVKSLFNTFLWLDTFISEYFEEGVINLDEHIYDNMILDYPSKKSIEFYDMYLLPKHIINNNGTALLNHLVTVNNLCSIYIEFGNKRFSNYFLPFIKPGIPRNMYYIDKKTDTHPLSQTIFKLRHEKIKDIFNKP